MKKERLLHGFSELLNQILFWFLRLGRPFRPLTETTGSVLIIRLAHIGDFVLWLDSARAYREVFPHKKLIFLTYQFKDVSTIAEKTGYFDQVRVLDAGWKGRLKSVKLLMRERYDVVINANPSRTLQSDVFTLAPRSAHRIAPQSDLTMITPRWLGRSDKAYTKIIPCGGIKTMELLRNAEFMRGLGAKGFKAALPVLPIFKDYPLPAEAYFAVCPGADSMAKCWPPRNFAKVCDRIITESGFPCVIVGGHGEERIGDELRACSQFGHRYLSLIGQTTLIEFIEVIRGAKWVISNDTSAGHIAAAVSTPAVVIDSGWDRGRFYPYATETPADYKLLPESLVPELDCIGCGKNPTVTGERKCFDGLIMKCIASVRADTVYKAWKTKIAEGEEFDG